jgi:hypothetical protein
MKVKVHIHKIIEMEVNEPIFEEIANNYDVANDENEIEKAITLIEEKTGLKCYDFNDKEKVNVEELVACYVDDEHETVIFEL